MRLSLLLSPAMCVNGDTQIKLDRKSAALLAYLALAGETPRGRLATLLWPDAEESVARNNLAQKLSRLKASTNHALVEGKETLRLTGAVGLDARDLQHAWNKGDFPLVADTRGVLLADLEFDDCPDFSCWLESQRESLDRLRREALTTLADQAEASGQHRAALGFARRLVDRDPLRETAHRRLMSLHALMGDQAAATEAYERCRRLLWEELGIRPGAETRALLKEIEIGGGVRRPPAAPAPERRPPFHLIRPPHFVGRHAHLARMEAAWDQGKAIFVAGEAGMGKTRLMQEFIADKGRCYLFEGFPEDADAPYSTYSRTFREVMRAFPHLNYPEWIQREAARILPELGGAVGLPVDDNDRLRFHLALAEANDLAVKAGMRRVVVDDLHLVDLPSLMAGHFVYARHWGRPDGMQTLMLLRPESFAQEGREAMAWVLDRDFGELILLDPLGVYEVGELLAGIHDAWRDWAPSLHEHSGGIPKFILETLKALHAEAGSGPWPADRLPDSLPVPEGARSLIRRRLDGLEPDAILLARLAALSHRELDIPTAAGVLERPAAGLIAPWASLEAQGMLRGGKPAHGILRAVLREAIPGPLREHLEAQLNRV